MLNNTYRESMRIHPYGYALYEPESSNLLTPGVCGYLTEDGRWTPLMGNNKRIDLGDVQSLRLNGLSPFEHLARAAPDKRTWGPKVSGRVTGTKVDFKADASLIPAGIPAEIGALYKFASSEAFGAILMTKTPVVRESLYGDTPFRLWCRENTPTILAKWPDVETRGLILVTSTYNTSHADINAWRDGSKEVSIGFKTSVVDVLEIAPPSEWYTAASDDGWITSKSENPAENKVVFFGGLYFKYRKLAPQHHALHQTSLTKLRGADPEAKEFKFVHDGYEYSAESEEIGEGEVHAMSTAKEGDDQQDDEDEF